MRSDVRPRVYEVEETFGVGGVDVEATWKCRVADGEATWLVRFDVDGEPVSTDVDETDVPYHVREDLLETVRADEAALIEAAER